MEQEIQKLKDAVLSLWILAQSKLEQSRKIMQIRKGVYTPSEIKTGIRHEYDLSVTKQSEYLLALPGKSVSHLHLIMFILKINTYVSQIASLAEEAEELVYEYKNPFTKELMKHSHLAAIYDDLIKLVADSRIAFDREDSLLARSVFKRVIALESQNADLNKIISDLVKSDKSIISEVLCIVSIIRKLQSIGDHQKNITTEIVQFLDSERMQIYHGVVAC